MFVRLLPLPSKQRRTKEWFYNIGSTVFEATVVVLTLKVVVLTLKVVALTLKVVVLMPKVMFYMTDEETVVSLTTDD